MILAILLLLSGLTISGVAIYYSVMGLIAIFSAAAVPIMIMGVSLEVGKLVIASWIKAQWTRIPRIMKIYGIIAVAVLMLITSLGIFGYLSKAHSDQTLVSGDVQAKIAIYDERIKTEKDNIEANRKQLNQMDAAVDQVLSRTDDEKGATKANEIRKSQLKDRTRLQNEILASQKKISAIQDERAPFAAENRKVEAEVGPIKYIAAFVYGANPDANILERAVTWVIILIVIVFDPLAVVMLLASQMTFAWVREEKQAKYEQDDGPLTVDQINQIKLREVPELTPEQTELYSETFPIPEPSDPTLDPCYKCGTPLIIAPGIGPFCPNKECDVLDNTSGVEVELTQVPIVTNSNSADNVPVVSDDDNIIQDIVKIIEKPVLPAPPEQEQPKGDGHLKKFAINKLEPVQVKEEPIKVPEQVIQETITTDTTPVELESDTVEHPFKKLDNGYIEYQGKKMHPRVLKDVRPDLGITEDDITSPKTSFGTNFPKSAFMGDQFVRVDVIPNRLFKFNGSKWIEQHRESTDVHLANEDYIKHIIEKLASGEMDPEMLTTNEQDAVAQFIKNTTP